MHSVIELMNEYDIMSCFYDLWSSRYFGQVRKTCCGLISSSDASRSNLWCPTDVKIMKAEYVEIK